MTKWFDTNYHYLVPEFESRQTFRLCSTAPVDAFREALALGIRTRPVLVGPVTFLLLGKTKSPSVDPLALLIAVPSMKKCSAGWPRRGPSGSRSTSRCWRWICRRGLRRVGNGLRPAGGRVRAAQNLPGHLLRRLARNLPAALRLPVAAVHLDLVRAPAQLTRALDLVPEDGCSRWA